MNFRRIDEPLMVKSLDGDDDTATSEAICEAFGRARKLAANGPFDASAEETLPATWAIVRVPHARTFKPVSLAKRRFCLFAAGSRIATLPRSPMIPLGSCTA